MGFNPSSMIMNVYTSNSVDVGTHDLILSSFYSNSTSYNVTTLFQLVIIHYCMRCAIVSSTIQDYAYDIGDKQLIVAPP